MNNKFILLYSQISNKDVALVGGKNASLGEMSNTLESEGIKIPDGFATTAEAFLHFLHSNNLVVPLTNLMQQIETATFSNLNNLSKEARALIMKATMPEDLKTAIEMAYDTLCQKSNHEVAVAVRSSATAEDLPNASFAGQHDSYLNRKGKTDILLAVKQCFASLFNSRAIKYRHDNGFEHMKVFLSAGVQTMVRSDLSCSGIAFTLEPESGFRDLVVISGCWGLGENIVQGAVNPDEFYVFKPTLRAGKKAIISKKMGSKAKTMIYAQHNSETISLENIDTPIDKRKQWVLSDLEIETIARWSIIIENHYKMPMDIEWAKDGINRELFIVQARPETVQANMNKQIQKEFTLKSTSIILTKGNAVGYGIATGKARVLSSPAEAYKLKKGEVLITDITNPDWDPIMKKAAAIVTNKGGRTSHAAIVARELGAIAIVGAIDATEKIKDGDYITVSCIEGKTGIVYDGKLDWEEKEINFSNIKMPETAPMMIVADPDKAFRLSLFPNKGVGLMRLEFIINNSIKIHPMALVKFDSLKDENARAQIEELTYLYPDKSKYFVDNLAQSVATIAAAFYPKDVIVRMSDFKTNEYANLLGGKQFEPKEENPMIGFRGASRYYNERYKEGFLLECEAMKIVRNEMGFTNVKLMIPFCRTVDEGNKVVALMETAGLKRGENGLEIYVMAEIPSNVILATEFAKVFDGFSIGSNDLTQLTLGLDRDSAIISDIFDENNDAVKSMIASVIKSAKESGVKIGLCGQAPSDSSPFASFLIKQGIDSISFNPDALLNGIENMVDAENKLKQK